MVKVLIFTLPTCAPCNALKADIKDKEFEAEIYMYDMSDPTGDVVELSVKYNVRSAPTVVVLKDDGSVYYSGTQVKTSEKINELVKEAKQRG